MFVSFPKWGNLKNLVPEIEAAVFFLAPDGDVCFYHVLLMVLVHFLTYDGYCKSHDASVTHVDLALYLNAGALRI